MYMQLRTIVPAVIIMSSITIKPGCSGKKNGTSSPQPGAPISSWLSKGDQSALLQKQTFNFTKGSTSTLPAIEVDSSQTFQSIDGFGYSLTGGSAFVINRLGQPQKSALLQELFGSGENSVSVSYLRVSIGASDLNANVFSYDDVPSGQTDINLTKFNLSEDTVDVVPLLKEILAINPSIKILSSPWSPPVWMKDNGSSVGGSLIPQYYDAYARYFVKYIQDMKARGITIDAITPQNEPLHPGNNPSLLMQATQQKDFIKQNLGPALKAAGLSTKIIVYDHNLDRPDYPLEILNDAVAKSFVDGSAFHLYAGDVSTMTTVHNAHPDKNVYFTEQWTGSKESFDGNLMWHMKNVIIGTMRNWSRIALEWNLASNSKFEPHTPGGCTECKGALTIDGGVTKNPSYYIIAHAAKFIPPGSTRIASSQIGNLSSVAFKIPNGKKALIVLNEGTEVANFDIKFKDDRATTLLPPMSVATYVW